MVGLFLPRDRGRLARFFSPPKGRRDGRGPGEDTPHGFSTYESNTRTFFQPALFSSMN
jgi:hypothetical protein